MTAKVVGHVLGDKIRIGKCKKRTGYRKQTGFRAASRRSRSSRSAAAKRATTAATAAAEKEAPRPRRKQRPTAGSDRGGSRRGARSPAHPPQGYEDFTVAEISETVRRWRRPKLEAALEYEQKNANRKGAIAALESALAAKQEN